MDAMQSGFMLLPNFIAGVITTRFAASKAGSWHPQTMRTVGCSLLVLSAILSALAFIIKQPPLLYAATFLLGLPSGFNNMGNQLELNRHVRPEDLGQATGIFRTSQFIGAAISTPIAFHTLHSATVPINPILLLMIAIIGIGLLTFIVDSIYRFRMHPVE
jgi:MFS family permease